jgi:hypothetical protein
LAWCRCLWLVDHVGCNCRSNRFGFGDLEQKRNNLSGGTAAN